MELGTVVHIGPPKTASTSLQNSVLPHLGRPFFVKPEWTKALSRGEDFERPQLPRNAIISDEALGDFSILSPLQVAKRLAKAVGKARVIYVQRDPLQQFYSLYRQALQNGLSIMGLVAGNTEISSLRVLTPDEFFDQQRVRYKKTGAGFFAIINSMVLDAVFGRRFDFHMMDFELLEAAPQSFVAAFSALCGSEAAPCISRDNVSTFETIAQAIGEIPTPPSADIQNNLNELYAFSRLSPDREDFLKNWRGVITSTTFTDAFRF